MSQVATCPSRGPSTIGAPPQRPRRDRLLRLLVLPALGTLVGALAGVLALGTAPLIGASSGENFWGLPPALGVVLCAAGGMFVGRQLRRCLERTWDRSLWRLVRAALSSALLAGLVISTLPAVLAALPEAGAAIAQYGLRGGVLLGIVLVKVTLAEAWALSVLYSLPGAVLLGMLAWGVHRLSLFSHR